MAHRLIAEFPRAVTIKDSSTIAAVAYHPKDSNLRIEFKSGGVYEYPEITADEFAALVGSSSPGSYFGKTLRNRPYTKIARELVPDPQDVEKLQPHAVKAEIGGSAN